MKRLIGFLFICVIIVVVSLIILVSPNEEVQQLPQIEEVVSSNIEPTEVEEIDEPAPITIELAMIGDVLLHRDLAVYDDFGPSLQPVSEFLQASDFLVANQESLPVASKFGISGYPQFSSPDYIVEDLKEVGVDLLNLANNHAVDKGEDGLAFAIENIEAQGLPYVGAYKNSEDRSTHRIFDVEGIKIGFVSYTYGTNGLKLPTNSPYIVNYIDLEKMKSDVEAIKPLVDVTVAIIHWGNEYVTLHNDNQTYIANMMNQAGVDIIFGGHPHVLQPYEKITNSIGQDTHIFYSLGNFFSHTTSSKDTMIGGIGSFKITKENEAIVIEEPKLIATSVILNETGRYTVYPLADVEAKSVRDLQWVKNIMGEQVIVE